MAARLIVTGAPEFVLIDKDTGTVLGSNVVAVWADRLTEEQWDEVTSSDSKAFDVAEEHGERLYSFGGDW